MLLRLQGVATKQDLGRVKVGLSLDFLMFVVRLAVISDKLHPSDHFTNSEEPQNLSEDDPNSG